MSWRTWLGTDRLEMADFNLCDYASMEELAKKVVSFAPSKLFAPNREIMAQFLKVLETEYGVIWDDLWMLKNQNG